MEGTKKFGGDNMPKFEVLIMETLEKVVTVEAEDEDEAIHRVEDMWDNGDYILDSENFTGVEFKIWNRDTFKVWYEDIEMWYDEKHRK